MGRSLGSAAAIEVAVRAGEKPAGLIVESGFSDTLALLARLGVRVPPGVEDVDRFLNRDKIARVEIPTLIIHGRNDVLIPPEDGRALYNACAAEEKELVLLPGGHNDLLLAGRE